MFASVLAGFRAVVLSRTSGLFVLPVDTPCPSVAVWRALASGDRPSVPVHGGKRGHPVFLPVGWVVETLAAIDSGTLAPAAQRLDTLLATTATTVAVDDPDACMNLNFAADFHAYTP